MKSSSMKSREEKSNATARTQPTRTTIKMKTLYRTASSMSGTWKVVDTAKIRDEKEIKATFEAHPAKS